MFDEAFKAVIGEVVRSIVREELRAVVTELKGAPSGDEAGYLSVERAATLAEVHPDTIRAWVKAGRLPEHRAGRELRIRRDELHRFLEGGQRAEDRPTPEQEAAAILARRRVG